LEFGERIEREATQGKKETVTARRSPALPRPLRFELIELSLLPVDLSLLCLNLPLRFFVLLLPGSGGIVNCCASTSDDHSAHGRVSGLRVRLIKSIMSCWPCSLALLASSIRWISSISFCIRSRRSERVILPPATAAVI
jgi:hypothetical protein